MIIRWSGHFRERRRIDFRLLFAYNARVDEQKQNGALLIAACIVACIRLKGEPITRSPKVVATISDSVTLARLVLREILSRGA